MDQHWGEYQGEEHPHREVTETIIMDLVVDDHVGVEAKTVERFNDSHFAQLNSNL